MVYLVRQGQTDWNLFKKFNGCTDTELNQTGIAQAKLQAENLRSVSFDACFCSPQMRARQTCEIIYKGPIVFDDRLAEVNCGDFEGTEETADAMKLFWQAIRNGDQGTESFEKFTKHNSDFCDMIMKDHKGKNVLIVTHSANARIMEALNHPISNIVTEIKIPVYFVMGKYDCMTSPEAAEEYLNSLAGQTTQEMVVF